MGEGSQDKFFGNETTTPEQSCGQSCASAVGCYAFDAYSDGCTLFRNTADSALSQGWVSVRRLGSGLWRSRLGTRSDPPGYKARSRCGMRADCRGALTSGAVVKLRNERSRDFLSAGQGKAVLHDNSASERDEWRVDFSDDFAGAGPVTFSSVHNGEYLHIHSSADKSVLHHLPIVTENVSSSKGSQWNVTCIGNQAGLIVQLENLRSHRYLHVDRSHVGEGSPVIQHNGAMSQGNLWLVIPMPPGLPPFPVMFLIVCCVAFLVLALPIYLAHKRWKRDAGAELVVGPSGLLERRDRRDEGRGANSPESGAAPSTLVPENPMCFVCGETLSDYAVVPCGHRCGCQGCMEEMHSGPGGQWHNCPICLGLVENIVAVLDLPVTGTAASDWPVAH